MALLSEFYVWQIYACQLRTSAHHPTGHGATAIVALQELPVTSFQLAVALARPLALRPYVRLTAAEVVGFDQLRAVWLDDEQAWFIVNKVDSWEDDQRSVAVELIRL